MKSSIALLAFSLLAAGCSALPVDESWEGTPTHKPLPAVFIEVDSDGIARYCGDRPGTYVHGCARRDYESRACFVFTRAKPQPWLVEHEKKHCAGWDHPTRVNAAQWVPDIQTAAVAD